MGASYGATTKAQPEIRNPRPYVQCSISLEWGNCSSMGRTQNPKPLNPKPNGKDPNSATSKPIETRVLTPKESRTHNCKDYP